MEKAEILVSFICSAESQLDLFRKSHANAVEGTVHGESRQEGKYDTRAIEAGYLAAAQSKRIAEIESQLSVLKKLQNKLTDSSVVETNALVHVKKRDITFWYFLLPVFGGEKIASGEAEIQILGPKTRLGQKIAGLTIGDEFEIDDAGEHVGEIIEIY